MTIKRKGSGRDHGIKSVPIEDARFRWEEDDGCIRITKRGVTDFGGASTHDYFIDISLEEVAEMLKVIAADPAVEAPKVVSERLGSSVKDLVRLTYVCLGGKVGKRMAG
jgi:hypothetical protein